MLSPLQRFATGRTRAYCAKTFYFDRPPSNGAYMSTDARLRTHPKERLASLVQAVDLTEAAERLRAEPHAAVDGHRQLAVVRHGPVSLILFVFEADGFMKEHQAEGEVIIQVLAGRLAVTAGGEAATVGKGELVSLAPGQPHALRALEPSEMLLTICKVPA